MKCFLSWILLLGSLALAGPVRALTMTPLEIEELAAQADLIVQGVVQSKTCQRDENGRIFTRVELRVAEVWKGQVTGSQLEIVHGGGVLGEQRSQVAGQVEYEPGEEVVAFLVRNQRNEAVTIGLAQGKFHVWTDEKSGSKLARNPFHGGGRTTAKAIATGKPSSLLTISRLKQRVQGSAQ